MFKINPTVNDIPKKFYVDFKGIKVLVMGAVRKGGGGCACPENTLLRSLLSEIILNRDEVVILDMEAGIEHLGRATAATIDKMVIIIEPTLNSLETARTIMKLAREIGITDFGIIGNKIQENVQELWMKKQISKDMILGTISYSKIIRDSDLVKQPLIDLLDKNLKTEFNVIYKTINPNSIILEI